MRKIYKYPFEVADNVVIEMPDGAGILKVECQAGHPCLWAVVDPGAPVRKYHFRVFGTGHTFPDDMSIACHTSTFQQGFLVWHLFQVP